MQRNRKVKGILGFLLVMTMLVAMLPVVISPSPVLAAGTTAVTITKLAPDGTTILGQTTITYQEMMASAYGLPVMGDGVTHYYHQGPVFIDDPDEATEQALRWNPAEDTNVLGKDMGALRGTNIKDLCNLVGGMAPGEELKVKSSDGWYKMFAYKNVYEYSDREGPMVLTWEMNGMYPTTGYSEGMRLVWFADDSVNHLGPDGTGVHAFGNWDWHEAADSQYWYYYVSGGEFYPTTTGLSGKYVSELTIYSNQAPPVAPVAAFTSDVQSGIAPLTVQFTDQSTNSPTSWAWDFDNNGVVDSTNQNPSHIYNEVGTFTVKLTATNAAGSDDEIKTDYITVSAPVAPTWYVSYLGGNGTDYARSIAVDSSGNSYITGYTTGSFPTTPGAYNTTYAGGTNDAFFSKFDSSGNLVYSTYLGGTGTDQAYGIRVDNSGNIYITGYTSSTDFPTTPGAYNRTRAGSNDAFFSKFDSSGNLVYSTYLGGSGTEYAYGIDVDNSGNSYITGYTTSTNFPTTPGAYNTTNAGGNDAFFSKFDSSGNLVYSTYLGGTSTDQGRGIGVDNSGNSYITGQTGSTNFPTTPGAYNTTKAGDNDVFFSKFDSSGNLVYSTYLGGTVNDYAYGIDMDNSGNSYITGVTGSTNFPTTPGAYQTTKANASDDAFLSKFTSSGNLVYSTYLGGNDTEQGLKIATDNSGNCCISGYTVSTNFPTTPDAYQKTKSPTATAYDAFISKFDSSGSLVYSTYLGGSSADFTADYAYGIALDSTGHIYACGYTPSTNFPISTDAYQKTFAGGNNDAFIFFEKVWEAPVAAFTSDVQPGTAPLTVHFSDQSTNTPTSWAWDFNNDGTVDSTDQNPTYIYTAAGTYTVKLTATNAGGSDEEVKTDYITVASPVPAWDLNGDGVCNISDVVVIGLVWGQTGNDGWIPEDLNTDGVINIGDVVVLGLHWGETW